MNRRAHDPNRRPPNQLPNPYFPHPEAFNANQLARSRIMHGNGRHSTQANLRAVVSCTTTAAAKHKRREGLPTFRSHLVSAAMLQPRAIPAFAANSTTLALGTGRDPGSPIQTGHTFVLGLSGLYRVLHEQYAWCLLTLTGRGPARSRPGGGKGGVSQVLHALAVRPGTPHRREDGALFPQDRS